MAIYKKGADPVALRASAERLTAHSRSCEAVKADAARAIHSLKGHWTGGDLQHLMGQWPPVEAQIGRFGDDLAKLAEALRRNAGQQDSTSGQGGSVPGFPGGGGNGNGNGGGHHGLPFYDLGKSILWPIKTGISAIQGIGTGMKIWNFIGNMRNLPEGASFFKSILPAWKTGYLAELGDALNSKNWGNLGRLVPFLEEGGALAKGLGTAGKILGPVGVAFGALNVANDISEGRYGRAAYDGVMTGLGAAALMTPPPVDIVCGVAAGAMAVGQLVYDHWDDISEFTSNAVDAVGDFAGDAVDAVGDFAGDAVDAVGDTLSSLNPFD